MLKKEADLLKKQPARELATHKFASQFAEVSEVRAFAWHPLDAVAFAVFVMGIMLFFV